VFSSIFCCIGYILGQWNVLLRVFEVFSLVRFPLLALTVSMPKLDIISSIWCRIRLLSSPLPFVFFQKCLVKVYSLLS